VIYHTTAGIDLDKLEALARAATPGPWTNGWPAIPFEDAVERIFAEDVHTREDAAFIAAANPATVLQLIELARRSTTANKPDSASSGFANSEGGRMPFYLMVARSSPDEIRAWGTAQYEDGRRAALIQKSGGNDAVARALDWYDRQQAENEYGITRDSFHLFILELVDAQRASGSDFQVRVDIEKEGDSARKVSVRMEKASGSDGTAAAGVEGTTAFEAWAKDEGLIQESHGIRSVSSMIKLAEKAWNAALARSLDATSGSELASDDDLILIPRGLIGAACYAVRKLNPESKLLPKLREYTTGAKSSAACQPAALTVPAAGAVCQPLADEQTMCIFPICTCAGRDTCVRAQKAVVPAKRSAIERIADELEDEAQPYEGEFADVVRGCVEALRELTIGAPSPAAEADQDAARLDYLEKYAVIAAPGQSIRAAIDAAMSQAKGAGKEGAA
jgi:hypothetical protein